MADYVLVDKKQLEADLKVVADSIRAKGGTTEALEFPQGMKSAVEAIQSGGGSEMTAGFTSEKYKKWLEVNGYTIVNFTLTSTATANFNINHPLGRPAKSIICFRADLDGSVVMDKICFAVSGDGSISDTYTNRLAQFENEFAPFVIGITFRKTDYRAILQNTAEFIQFRYVNGGGGSSVLLNWESGDYYMAVL